MPLDHHQSGERVMTDVLSRQKAAQRAQGASSAEIRIDRLNRCIDILVRRRKEIEEAASNDFGLRSKDVTAFTDTATSITQLRFARERLRRWMKPQRRSAEFPFGLLGAAAWIEFQPKGVVGIVSPWNFPVSMAIGPLSGALAAGNRAMLKPSEFTEATSRLLEHMMTEAFDQDEVAVVNGGPEVGAAFTRLPFDHLLFTGSTSVGKSVMRAAAENLVPVTLELGGKSPVILGRTANLETAALRIMHGKVVNAGQICVAPDYVMAPVEMVDEFVAQAKAAVSKMLPSGARDNQDYASIINQRHYDRLKKLLSDAKDKGANIIVINPHNEDFTQQPHYIMPPILVLNVTDNMNVMQEEIFGPILPIILYKDISDAIAYINARDHPLALYYFGEDKSEQRQVLSSTISGGVTVNDVLFHVAQEDLPFGGVGASGMGAYHGREGFYEFSHKKSVYRQTSLEIVKILRPPYTDLFRNQIAGRIKN